MLLRRLAPLLLLLATISSLAFAQPVTKWGLSKKEVRGLEDEKLMRDTVFTGMLFFQGFLAYKTQVAKFEGSTFYLFLDDKLWKAQDYFPWVPEHLCLEQYERLAKFIAKKYGKPTSVEENWKYDSLSRDADQRARHIADGNLSIISIWQSPSTTVRLMVFRETKLVSIAVDYLDREFIETDPRFSTP